MAIPGQDGGAEGAAGARPPAVMAAPTPADGGASRRCPSCGQRYPLDFVVCPKDATALERPESGNDRVIGEVLAGAFRITGILGQGGMGRVYEAEHIRLPRRFAVKVMQEELSKHSEAITRFEREAQAISRVRSEHVIEVVDLVRLKDGRPCLVTELLVGEELGEMLQKSGKLAIPVAVAIARQVCRGLAAAHAAGVVHRDLKPSNLFLSRRTDGRPFVKILDFGVAKLEGGAKLTKTGMVVGTPAYMSPEQARGSAGVDDRADVYSTGAVLYHMLTGSPPFAGDDPTLVLTRVLTEDPQRPRELNRAIPDALEHLVQRAMARSPEGRPRSMVDLEHELDALGIGASDISISLVPSTKPSAAFATSETLEALIPGVAKTAADGPVRGGRWSRASATSAALVFAVAAGGSAFASGMSALRLHDGRGRVRDTEVLLVGVVSLIALVGLLVVSIRAIASRWQSAPAIDRLGAAFGLSCAMLLAASGGLQLVHFDYLVFGPAPPNAFAPILPIVTFGAPLLFGVVVFFLALRRANRP